MIHSNSVLVLGGTNDHIELIEQLKQLLYYVVLVDYFDNPPAALWANQHEKVSTRDINAIETIIKKYKPIHIFSACVDSSLYALCECQSKFGYHTLFTKAQYNIISNKHQMKLWMQKHSFPSGQFQIINKHTKRDTLCFELPMVIKPTMGNSSKGVSLIHNEANWQEALDNVELHAKDIPILVEEFIDGTELSVDLAFINGHAHIIMISEIIKKSFFSSTITKNVYNRETETFWEKDILTLANAIGKTLELENSLMLLQCIVNTSGISIVEFSLRIGGGSKHHLIKRIKNIDMIALYIQLMLQNTNKAEQLINVNQGQIKNATIEYLYPTSSGKINELTIPLNSENSNIFVYKKQGDILTSTENSSNRIAGIFVWGNKLLDINEHLEAIKQSIHFKVSTNKTTS